MKKLFLVLVMLISISVTKANAQRYLPKMKGLELRGGIVNGFTNLKNFYTGLALSSYTMHKNRWIFGMEYLQKEYAYKELMLPKSQFTAEAGYYYMFLSDPRKMFFLSIGGSELLGYETSNWGEKLLYDGATLMNNDAFLYGGAITFEIENYISDKIVLLVNARERILFGSSIGKFHTQIGLGLKFIIN
ncbi:MAG: conjugal transfer protein TraO [Bacteroidetes bacterium]|nr:conjugal transfer protein TraO [Bacteroidota bacterium]